MLVGVWQINTGVGETPVLSAFQSYAGNNSCTASNFYTTTAFPLWLILDVIFIFQGGWGGYGQGGWGYGSGGWGQNY